jgi:hypothetical protein
MSQAMERETRPPIIPGGRNQLGPEWVGLDVPQNDQQMSISLNNGALEPPLPDMTSAVMSFVVSPGMRDGKRLEDSADRLPGLRPDEQVKVIGHEAIAEQAKRIAVLGIGEGAEEGSPIGIVPKDISAVVAAVEDVIDQSVIDGSR